MDLVTYNAETPTPPRELNVDVLLFIRWLIEHGRMEIRRDEED